MQIRRALVGTMKTGPVEYIGSFDELLAESHPADQRFTKVGVFQMPKTLQLQDRYCMTIAGPEALQLAQLVLTWVDQVADQIAQKNAGV
jgi:hypothetical protein